jgi:hypothetical protein
MESHSHSLDRFPGYGLSTRSICSPSCLQESSGRRRLCHFKLCQFKLCQNQIVPFQIVPIQIVPIQIVPKSNCANANCAKIKLCQCKLCHDFDLFCYQSAAIFHKILHNVYLYFIIIIIRHKAIFLSWIMHPIYWRLRHLRPWTNIYFYGFIPTLP